MANCYNNGIIYKLCCKDTAIKDIYVGSTCAFRRRKYEHKSNCNNENSKSYNCYVYKFIRDHGGFSNWEMIEIKQFNCETKRELEKEERAVLETLGGTLNSSIPTRDVKEWRGAKKEHIKKVDKVRYEANKEHINEMGKVRYHANKEEINKKNKERYAANKEKILEKFNCGCGGIFRKYDKLRHIKTPKHQKYLESLIV